MKLTLEFNESGGYDCMFGAWVIKRDGEILVEVDQQNFGQHSCDYSYRSSEAEEIACVILKALHAHYASHYGAALVRSDKLS